MTRRAFIGLGSNIGDRQAHLEQAAGYLPDVIKMSSIWETAPVGGPEQGAYLNMVVQLSTDRTARQLLNACWEREAAAERERLERWGPRTLDCDVLWIDGETVHEHDLIVPHPRMFERAFVLVPLRELAPDLIPDGFEEPSAGEVWPYVPLTD